MTDYIIQTIHDVVGTAITVVIASTITLLISRVRHKKKEEGSYKPAITSILRNEIVKVHHKHVSKKEPMTRAIFRAMEDMYREYHELGGNGYIDKCVEDIRALNIID